MLYNPTPYIWSVKAQRPRIHAVCPGFGFPGWGKGLGSLVRWTQHQQKLVVALLVYLVNTQCRVLSQTPRIVMLCFVFWLMRCASFHKHPTQLSTRQYKHLDTRTKAVVADYAPQNVL